MFMLAKEQGSVHEEHTVACGTVFTAIDEGMTVMWVISELPESLDISLNSLTPGVSLEGRDQGKGNHI